MDRRHFLSSLGHAAAATGTTWAVTSATANGKLNEQQTVTPAPLPTVSLGPRKITRLVVGSNPLLGYSYLGPHTDRHMREYFTVERTVEFLLSCEKAGINTFQFSYSANNVL